MTSPLPDASTLEDASSLPDASALQLPSDMHPSASAVTTMTQVREAIDNLDQQIVDLLGQRMRYIEAAARIKPNRGAVRDEWRKQDVIDKAARKAREVRFPEELVRKVYEDLVEGSIAHEFKKWDARNGPHEKN